MVPQSWNDYWPESGGSGVSEGQEVTEQTALHHGQPISHAPLHTTEAAELLP